MGIKRQKNRKIRHMDEAHDEARLVNAERESRNLKNRAEQAIRTLDDRRRRNHWRESIEQMIQGVR